MLGCFQKLVKAYYGIKENISGTSVILKQELQFQKKLK